MMDKHKLRFQKRRIGVSPIFGFLLSIALAFFLNGVLADTVDVSVTIINSAPAFSVLPYEDPASITADPTDAGSSITFRALGTDPNEDDYYLAICTTNAITASGVGAPSCDDGSWCVSGANTSGLASSCSYASGDLDSESNAWYAFVCDGVTDASCSAVSQGSGDSGSPFNINHRPDFSAVVDDGGTGGDSGAEPGGSMTFTATADDSDTSGSADTVKVIVCADTDGATSAGCAGTELCQSDLSASNPSCIYTISDVISAGNYPYYSYVFDSHDFGAADNYREGVYVVSNSDPVISNISINGGSDISLTEMTTTNIDVTMTVTDSNGCSDIDSVVSSLYRSDLGFSACDNDLEDNDNQCYAAVTCAVVASGNTCSGGSDSSADYVCTFSLQYLSDPTDADTVYEASNWLTTISTVDQALGSDVLESASGVEVLSLVGYDVQGSLDYGSIREGEDSGSTNQTGTVQPTGNVGLDIELFGNDLSDGTNDIPVSSQEYAASAFTYGEGINLSEVATELELNVLKPTDINTVIEQDVYFGMGIPIGTVKGQYTGINYLTGVKSEIGDW